MTFMRESRTTMEYSNNWNQHKRSGELEAICQLILLKSRGLQPRAGKAEPPGVRQVYPQDASALARCVVRTLGAESGQAWKRAAQKSRMLTGGGSECAGGSFMEKELVAAVIWGVLNGYAGKTKRVQDGPIYEKKLQAGFELYERIFGKIGERKYRILCKHFLTGDETPYRALSRVKRSKHEIAQQAYEVWKAQKECCKAFSQDDFIMIYKMDMEEALWYLSGGAVDHSSVSVADKDVQYYQKCCQEMKALAYLWNKAACENCEHTRMLMTGKEKEHYFKDLFMGDKDMILASAYALGIDVKMTAVARGVPVRDVAI